MSKVELDLSNRTLVHICCSVDSHHFLTQLQKTYPDKKFCGYFYNPNIHPYDEYLMRLKDVQRSCEMLDIPLIVGEYDLQDWLEGSKGLEEEPEKGERCSFCFDYRLSSSVKVAKEYHCSEFTTTLLASPMKSQQELFAQGEAIAKKEGLGFLPIDVRGSGGTKVQNELAKGANLYRQNYCGCLYALKKQREKSNKLPFELISTLSLPKDSRNLPTLRLKNFKTREVLEKEQKPYYFAKRKVLQYRLLKGILTQEGKSIPSFICSYSMLHKPTKARIELWQDGIGYASKEGILFLEFSYFQEILQKNSFEELLKEGLSEEIQLKLRMQIYAEGFFISPIVILKEQIFGEFSLEIQAISQEESLEDFIRI